jgi:hypothetical protein
MSGRASTGRAVLAGRRYIDSGMDFVDCLIRWAVRSTSGRRTRLAESCPLPASISASLADRFLQTQDIQQIRGGQQIEFLEKEIVPGNGASQLRVPSFENRSIQDPHLLASLNLLETRT